MEIKITDEMVDAGLERARKGTFAAQSWYCGDDRLDFRDILRAAIGASPHLSAAPDLLAACELALLNAKAMPEPELGRPNWPLIAEWIEASIAKAKGESA